MRLNDGYSWLEVIAGVVTAIGTGVLGKKGWNAFVDRFRSSDSESPSEARAAEQCETLKAPIPQTVCLILGQGGTGKTTLIRSITDAKDAKPEVETQLFKIYETRLTTNHRECKLVFSDYRGQDLGVLTSGLQAIEETSGIRRKDFSSVLIILDICDTDSGVPRDPQGGVPDYDHIRKQVEQWNGQALNAVVGLLVECRLRFVLVLINKFDLLLRKEEREHEDQISAILEPFRDKLRSIWPHVQLDIMFGSGNGRSAISIRNTLAHHSVAQEP